MKKVPGIDYGSHIKYSNQWIHKKNLEGSDSDIHCNEAVWKVKHIYPIFPSGFYWKKLNMKHMGENMQSTIKLKTLTRKEILPAILNP